MPTQTTLKQFIKNNVFYQNFIRPIRVKWKEKALAKLDDQSYFTKRQKTILVLAGGGGSFIAKKTKAKHL